MTRTAAPTELLQARLRQRALSRAHVADITGIPYLTICRALRSPSNPPLLLALLVSELLGAEVEELFSTNPRRGSGR